MDVTIPKQPSMDTPSWLKHNKATWIAMIAGISLSIALAYFVRDWEKAMTQADFELIANSRVSAIHNNAHRHKEAVESLKTFFYSSQNVTRYEFESFITPYLKNHSDIQNIHWVLRAPSEQKENFKTSKVNDGRSSSHFETQQPNKTSSPITQTHEFFPVIYTAALTGNELTAGYDLASDTTHWPAMQEARDSGQTVITPPITIKQATGEEYGTSFITPIYSGNISPDSLTLRRSTLQGFVIFVIRINDAMNEAFAEMQEQSINVFLSDDMAAKGKRLLYSSKALSNINTLNNWNAKNFNHADLTENDTFSFHNDLYIGKRKWSLHFSPTELFYSNHTMWRAMATFSISLLLTLFLCIYLHREGKYNKKIKNLAASLSKTNDRLRKKEIGHQQIETSLNTISEAVSAATGNIFFQKMAQHLSKTLDVEFALIGETIKSDPKYIHTVAVYSHGSIVENFKYLIKGTPCENVLGKEICFYPEHASNLFPDDKSLSDKGIKSYLGVPLHDNTGTVTGLVSIMSKNPLSSKQPAEPIIKIFATRIAAELQHKQSLGEITKLSSTIEQTADAIMITDTDGIIEYVNHGFEVITGHQTETILGQSANILKSKRHEDAFYANIWKTIKSGNIYCGIIINCRNDGRLYYEEKTITPFKNDEGVVTNYISTGKDITARMQTEERMHFMAYHDLITELPNRALFTERLTHALTRRDKSKNSLAVLFLDMDRFKNINDSLGHDVGDKLLQAFSARLVNIVRKGDTVARFGGDEFAILVEDSNSANDIAILAKNLMEELSEAFEIEERELFITSSIGVSIYPQNGHDAATLIKHADIAMYRAKENGRNNFHLYSSEMNNKAKERLTLESELHHAFENNEFVLHYQPQIDLKTGYISGAEALLRWQHSKRGLISPLDFIPLLEENGMISTVGQWVLQTACAQTQQWELLYGRPFRIAVNLSGRQFYTPNLSEQIKDTLLSTGLPAKSIELEITESVLMQNNKRSIDHLNAIHELGIRLAIDDFGTGYSSLNYLKRFPVDTLKIDRSFIKDAVTDSDDRNIVTAIIAMAHSLHLDVVAEGIEYDEQLGILQTLNCNHLQGFLFSKPIPAAELEIMLCENRRFFDPFSDPQKKLGIL